MSICNKLRIILYKSISVVFTVSKFYTFTGLWCFKKSVSKLFLPNLCVSLFVNHTRIPWFRLCHPGSREHAATVPETSMGTNPHGPHTCQIIKPRGVLNSPGLYVSVPDGMEKPLRSRNLLSFALFQCPAQPSSSSEASKSSSYGSQSSSGIYRSREGYSPSWSSIYWSKNSFASLSLGTVRRTLSITYMPGVPAFSSAYFFSASALRVVKKTSGVSNFSW